MLMENLLLQLRNQSVCDFFWNHDTVAISWKNYADNLAGLWLAEIISRDDKKGKSAS